jgi:tetratricopeptide (TPR) repeat protein
MLGLANGYTVVERHAEALEVFAQTLAIQKAKLGPDHPDTLLTMNNLGSSYTALGRHEDALALRQETLKLMSTKLGPDHPTTLTGMKNLANSLFNVGRKAEALKLREEVLALRQAKLGADHPESLQSMAELAECYRAVNQYAEAVSIIDACLARLSGKAVKADLTPMLLNTRLRFFQTQQDSAGCLETADKWDALKRADAQSFYQSACIRAVCAAVIRKTDTTPAGQARAQEQADQAMAWLKQAVAAGYQNLAHIREDADLDVLRDRDDFRSLLAELEARLERAKPASAPSSTSTAP